MNFNTETLYNYGSSMAKAAFVGASTAAGAATGFTVGAVIGGTKGLYNGAKKGFDLLTADVSRKKDDSVAVEYALKAIPAIIAPVAYGAYGAISEGAQCAYQGGKMAYNYSYPTMHPEKSAPEEETPAAANADENENKSPIEAHLEELMSELNNSNEVSLRDLLQSDDETSNQKPYLPSKRLSSKEKDLFELLAQESTPSNSLTSSMLGLG